MCFKVTEINDPEIQYEGLNNINNKDFVEETNELLNWTLEFWLSNEDPFGGILSTTD